MTDLERAAQINASIRAHAEAATQADMLADALKREREHEREECARIADAKATDYLSPQYACKQIAETIRARQ